MRQTWDGLPDAILRLDGERRITEANPAAGRLAGADASALTGRAVSEVFDPRSNDGTPLLSEGWHRSASLSSVNTIPEHEVTIRASSGDVRARVTGCYERNSDGSIAGATLAVRPSRRHANDEPTGSEVVSTVSHELRSPLTSVKGYTSLLLNRWERLKDEQKRMMLEQVHSDADRVTRLITELLDISRLETGRLVLRRQRVNITELAAQVVEKLRLAYPELECSLEFDDDFPIVFADPDKVEQVLTNLVENATKYASPLGMRVIGTSTEGHVTVAVRDNGEGIPRSDLPMVFKKFFRRDMGRPTGTGLGLWISRGLVEAHGGRLTAESIVGEGSTFSFTLPLVSMDDLFDPNSSGD